MRLVIRTAARLRLAALLALGAFALHQLRYLIAYGGGSSQELARQGHDYMAAALPLLAALALSALAATAVRARLGPKLTRGPIGPRMLTCALALIAIFSLQELLEGALAADHPAGPAALIGRGGWVALPLALALGALVALAVRALEGVELALAAARARSSRARAPRVRGRARRERRASRLLSPLAFGLARRPPPVSA